MGHAMFCWLNIQSHTAIFLKQNYSKVHPIMLIASCTSIKQRLTAWQDDGRAVTASVIPLTLPASTQTPSYKLSPSPDGIFGSFRPTLRQAATSQQLTRKGLQQERIWTPHSAKRPNCDDQKTHTETHRYYRAVIYLLSSHLRGFYFLLEIEQIYFMQQVHLTLGSKSQAGLESPLCRRWPMVSPFLARQQLSKPQQVLQWIAWHKRAISSPLAQGSLSAQQRFHPAWRKQEKWDGDGKMSFPHLLFLCV